MDAHPSRSPNYRSDAAEPAKAYRVALWEQPSRPELDQSSVAWHEMTFDLVDVRDAREAIQWAEGALASGKGPLSSEGVPLHDSEYVVYAKVPDQARWLHLTGWIPTRDSESPLNLKRRFK